MPAYPYPYYTDNRPVALDGTIHYAQSRLSSMVRNVIRTYYQTRMLDYKYKYKNNNSDDDIDSNDEMDSDEDRDSYDLMRIERLQYRVDIRRATTRSYSLITGIDYSKEVDVKEIKRWAGADEQGLLSLASFSWLINEAIKHRKDIRGPVPDGWGWKQEDKLLAFLSFLAYHGKLFIVTI